MIIGRHGFHKVKDYLNGSMLFVAFRNVTAVDAELPVCLMHPQKWYQTARTTTRYTCASQKVVSTYASPLLKKLKEGILLGNVSETLVLQDCSI